MIGPLRCGGFDEFSTPRSLHVKLRKLQKSSPGLCLKLDGNTYDDMFLDIAMPFSLTRYLAARPCLHSILLQALWL